MAKTAAVEKNGLPTNLEQHPLALQLAPGSMSVEEFDAFVEDLKARGQQVKITMFQGKVLDGWHRYTGLNKLGKPVEYTEYTGTDPEGLVLALNVFRRKLSTTQRAISAAQLAMNYGHTQDDAAKRVGVSKVHVNLVVQTYNSKNARLIKMLETSELSRSQLTEELYNAGVLEQTSAVNNGRRVDGSAANAPTTHGDNDLTSLLGSSDDGDGEHDSLLGTGDALPPPGNNVVPISSASKAGGTAGKRVAHPERRSTTTPAQAVADSFKSLLEAEKIDFLKLVWHVLQPAVVKAKADPKNPQCFAAPSKRGGPTKKVAVG